MNLWCLHGNLQLPSAWNNFSGRWHAQHTRGDVFPIKLQCPNLWKEKSLSLEGWAQNFCTQVEQGSEGIPQWLMGYSMGGRLALHAVLENPHLWAGVIVVGAHPGFASATSRKKQLDWDKAWALRFREKSWKDLLAAWDALPVFCSRPNTSPRPETAFSRAEIARCFEVFSKGNQDFLTPALTNLPKPPILFISGIEDEKYTSIGRQLSKACSVVEHVTIADAGHRVPWENPEAFSKIIQVFLDTTSYT